MGTLTLQWQADGPRYYLDGTPVHAGDLFEASMSDGAWTTVRFECSWDRKTNTVEPYLILPRPDHEHHLLPIDTPCRWPVL